MDELKTRLEFLEHVTSAPGRDASDEDLLQQIDNLGASLHELVDKRGEMHGRAQELAKQSALAAQLSPETTSKVPETVRAEVISAQLDDTAKFADELDTHSNLEIPSLRPSHVDADQSQVFTEFDEASARSVQVSQRWLSHVADTNSKTGAKDN